MVFSLLAVTLAASIAVLAFVHTRNQHQKNTSQDPKFGSCKPLCKQYPHNRLLLGADLIYEQWNDFQNHRLSQGMLTRHKLYGTTFGARESGLSNQQIIFTIDPENIKTITSYRFEDWGKGSWVGLAKKQIGEGILMNEGHEWRRSRTTLQPLFTRKSREDPSRVLQKPVRELVDVIRRQSHEVFDLRTAISRSMLSIATDFLFGDTYLDVWDTSEEAEAQQFLSWVSRFERISAAFIAAGPIALFSMFRKIPDAVNCVRGMKRFFWKQGSETISCWRREQEEKSNAFNPKAHQARHCEGLDNEDNNVATFLTQQYQHQPSAIHGEVRNVFFASYDTTTALLSNIFYVLSKRPDIQEKLRAEVATHLNQDFLPTLQDINRLPYLRATIWECLRLFTPVPYHTRRAIRDTILPLGGGQDGKSALLVREGTTVTWSIYSLNRRKDIFGANADIFDPNRWLNNENLSMKMKQNFMPFGFGPRQCIGRQIALTNISYVTIRLIQGFKFIESQDQVEFGEAKAISYYCRNGVLVSMS